jgi:hypothetical protein
MPILVLEEPRFGRRRAVIASSTNPILLREFWSVVIAEAEAAVRSLERDGEDVLAAVERAEPDRLRRMAPLFGGDRPES